MFILFGAPNRVAGSPVSSSFLVASLYASLTGFDSYTLPGESPIPVLRWSGFAVSSFELSEVVAVLECA